MDDEAKDIEAKIMRSKKATTVEDIEAEILLLKGKHEATHKKIEALQKKQTINELQQQAWTKRKEQAEMKLKWKQADERDRQKKQQLDREFKKLSNWIRLGGARGLTEKAMNQIEGMIARGHSHEEAIKTFTV